MSLHSRKCFGGYLMGAKGVLAALAAATLAASCGAAETGGSWDAATASLDPNSAALMQTFLGYAVVNPGLTLNAWGVALADSANSSPCYSVPLRDGGPIDPTVCIPLGTRPDPAGDGHLTVRDAIHGRETDFWQAVYDPTSRRIVKASGAASFPLGFWTECAGGCPGGDAANFPLRRGLVTPEEIQAGIINHPLVFSTPQIGAGSPRFPATHNVATTTLSGHLAEGTWLRMDPTVDCSAYGIPSWQVTICVALQRYGMFLRDNGGTLGIYGENPINRGGATVWTSKTGLEGGSAAFASAFPWSRLQVLQPPPKPSLKLTPNPVKAGKALTITGSADGCPIGNTVFVISHAFPPTHKFAGVSAVLAKVRPGGSFHTSTTIPSMKPASVYASTARCGGGNLGVLVHLHVTH
jgi:hypothetical protein